MSTFERFIIYGCIVIMWIGLMAMLESNTIAVNAIKATETRHYQYDVTVQPGASVVLPNEKGEK